MSVVYLFALILFLCIAALLCFVIMIQESKTSGLGAAFGAADSETSLFGASTADVLRKFTTWLVVIFMVSCVLLSLWTSSLGRATINSRSQAPVEQTERTG